MSINCVSKCKHQLYGNCTLNELPSATQLATNGAESGCPYFVEGK
ncbi:MAG: hydroxymyristoyl-ACP dehydratase [Clostridiales bacterium]|nr:hydroxymyristoyl-ACP dehydratase [Clostridiales bacterium]